MKDKKNVKSCLWTYKFELLGVILLAIATLLTIFTLDGIGIAAMFLVALIICGHKCLCNKCCKECYPENDEQGINKEVKSATKKSNVK
jgi:hypothetical protein